MLHTNSNNNNEIACKFCKVSPNYMDANAYTRPATNCKKKDHKGDHCNMSLSHRRDYENANHLKPSSKHRHMPTHRRSL